MRAWLEANKVWFETIAASLLSLMAIVMSAGQYYVASKQTELLNIQTKVAEAQALPQFEIEMSPRLNDYTKKYDDYDLVIRNRGGMVQQFHAEVALFLELSICKENLQILKARIPVDGYFPTTLVSAEGVGQLVKMIGNHNNSSIFKIAHDVDDIAAAKKLQCSNLEQTFVLRIQYSDLLGRSHEDYYEPRYVGGAIRIPDDLGKSQFAEWENGPRIQLGNLKPNELFDMAKLAN